MEINFDMDGTIANLYGVDNWLEYLINEDVTPYAVAKPLMNMQALARVLNRLIREGHEIRVISWLSKSGSDEYGKAVTEAKINWLRKHLASVHFSEIVILPYGEPKQNHGNGILFDDEERNRLAWGEGAYDVDNIIGVLKTM